MWTGFVAECTVVSYCLILWRNLLIESDSVEECVAKYSDSTNVGWLLSGSMAEFIAIV